MKVVIWPSDRGGSGFYRVTEVARAVNQSGLVEVEIVEDLDIEGEQHLDGQVWIRACYLDADVLVVQRPLNQSRHAIIERVQKQGVTVVVDIDDDFHRIHARNGAARAFDDDPWEHPGWLLKSARMADAVTVSTPSLCKYAATPGQAVVVPNYLPRRIFDVRNRLERVSGAHKSIGWTGTVQTHPTDLQRTGRVLTSDVFTDNPFVVIGDEHGVYDATGRVPLVIPWTKTVPAYWDAIRCNIDIGIVPLDVSAFNKAKSWLKGAEFASLGVPFVASPLGEYRKLLSILDPTSQFRLLAASRGQWQSKLSQLATDGGYWRDVSDTFIEHAQDLTLEHRAHQWVDAWKMAMDHRRSHG